METAYQVAPDTGIGLCNLTDEFKTSPEYQKKCTNVWNELCAAASDGFDRKFYPINHLQPSVVEFLTNEKACRITYENCPPGYLSVYWCRP